MIEQLTTSQARVVEFIHNNRFAVIKKERSVGATFTALAYACANQGPQCQILYVTPNLGMAKYCVRECAKMLNVPRTPHDIVDNIRFCSVKTASTSGVGRTFDIIIFDDCYPSVREANEVMERLIPCGSPRGRMIEFRSDLCEPILPFTTPIFEMHN